MFALWGKQVFLSVLLCASVLAADAPLRVAVSILPQAEFVERVGGERVEVLTLVGPGQSPHTYDPTPKEMVSLAEADVYFRIGVPFEDSLADKIESVHRGLRIVDTRQGIPLRRMEEHTHDEAGQGSDSETHHVVERMSTDRELPTPEPGIQHEGPPHEGSDKHAAGSPDPHIWMNPRNVAVMAETICETLAGLAPAHAGEFRENLRIFRRDLDRLDHELAQTLAPLAGRKMFVFHPAFGYFADAYHLKQVPVEVGGKEPSARQLAALIEHAKVEDVNVIFVQQQYSAKGARTLAQEIDAAVVPIDPLARDYVANLRALAGTICRHLAAEAPVQSDPDTGAPGTP